MNLRTGISQPPSPHYLHGRLPQSAHCDTLDGPVVSAARKALDTGDINLVLAWTQKSDDKEIRNAFDKARAVRKAGGPAKELADAYFFETLVRVHRAGEGASYTGLKPAGEIEPAIAAADLAITTGKLEPIADMITKRTHSGLHQQFDRVMATDPTTRRISTRRARTSARTCSTCITSRDSTTQRVLRQRSTHTPRPTHMRIPIEETSMKLTIPAPFQTERHALHARLAAPSAGAATRFQSLWQGRGVIRNWLSSRRVQVLLAITLLGVERISAQVFGVDLLPGLGNRHRDAAALGHRPLRHIGRTAREARGKALEDKNVNMVLPWVRPEDESEIRHAFDHAQAVRDLGPEARSLADRHFLETLVRIHRAGEGAPFTGLKPAGLDLGPAVPAADRALKVGSADAVVKLIVDVVSAGVRARFQTAAERQRFDPNDVAAGRRYVEAYVPYVHYVERLWAVATGSVHGHSAEHETQAHQSKHAAHHH